MLRDSLRFALGFAAAVAVAVAVAVAGATGLVAPMRMSADVEAFNHRGSDAIDKVLAKELSRPDRCGMTVKSGRLPELYFHMNSSVATVHVRNSRITSSDCIRATHITNDMFASRLELAIAVPAIRLAGDLTVATVRLSRLKENSFSLVVRNVTATGLCFTRWTDSDYRVKECDLRYEHAQSRSGAAVAHQVEETVLVEKMWKGVAGAVGRGVVDGLNAALRRTGIADRLKNREVYEKYKNYVIESTESANEFVDGIMDSVRRMIQERYNDTFAIPNIREGFQKKVLLVTWRGSFTADRGTVHGLSTVTRVGDTAFATDNASQTHFYGNLSFSHLNLHYEQYRAEFMQFGPTGTLDTVLQPIRLHIHPYVNFNTGRIYLEDFEIQDVGDLVVEVTGLGGALNWIASRIATWVVGLARDKILDNLQRRYDAYIKSVLSGYTIRDILSGKAFNRP